jgi:hypothetical protein
MHAYNLFQVTHDYILITLVHREGVKNAKILELFTAEARRRREQLIYMCLQTAIT